MSSSVNVSDHRSNSYEQIEFAVKKINRSKDRLKVFQEIYRGKKPRKTVAEISAATGLSAKRVVEEAKVLSSNDIVGQLRVNKKTTYEKYPFFSAHKEQIIKLVHNPEKLKKLPSKRTKIVAQTTKIVLPKNAFKIRQLFIDDIDSFNKVKKGAKLTATSLSTISEKAFKTGIQQIIGQGGAFTDWGGESNDLLTTKILLKGKRTPSAFAFKGPGTKGKLTPRKMGKNGDQIQRLFKSPADLFVLQYWNEIDGSVYEQMEVFAKIQSAAQQKLIQYCVIDGQDTRRLISAFPAKFIKSNKKKK
jgi:hypothetical protein